MFLAKVEGLCLPFSREESHVVCLVAALDEADASLSGEGVDGSCDGIASLL